MRKQFYKFWNWSWSFIHSAWDYLVYHLVPSRRYHKLDLRQHFEVPELNYNYGWLDADIRMVFAAFNILNSFVHNEMNDFYFPSEEDIRQDASLIKQRQNWLEIKALYQWWNFDRVEEYKAYLDAVSAWGLCRDNKTSDSDAIWRRAIELKRDFNMKEDEMFMRLVQVRHCLWT